LLLIARNQDRLDAAARELTAAHGVAVRVLSADLAREDDIERVGRVLEAEKNVGVLVNNAGFGTKGVIARTPLEPQMQMLRLQVLAPMRLTRAVLPGMIERDTGWIINVSSIAGFMYGAGNANYSASKAYLTRFSLALDAELTGTHVRVQALCPGFTKSEFHDRMKLDRGTIPAFLWMSADRVVDKSLAAIARNGAVAYVPGLLNKVMARAVRVLPHFIMRRGRRIGK
jgi:hypothetical protein